MAAIPLSDLSRAIAYNSVPWAKQAMTIKRASFPKGVTPPHLAAYTDKFKEAVSACKAGIKKGQGAATVRGFNACISAKLR
ncbi:MAG: hypothetical protein ACOYWZ_06655 [Bacillota bacterium]